MNVRDLTHEQIVELLELSRSLKLKRDRRERNSCPLPFDMSVAPRVFSKLKRFVMEPLRIQGIRTVYYLDSICLLARTKDEMFPIQHEDNDYLSPYYKDGETNKSCQTIVEVTDEEIILLVSKFDWKNYCNDSSDGRCAPTCTVSSKRPSQEPTPTTTELRSSMPIVSRFTTGTRMVADDEFKMKWVAHTHRQQQTGRIAKARLHYLRRCFRLRLEITPRAKQRETCVTVQRQLDSNKVCYEARRNSITNSASTSIVDSRDTYQQPDYADLPIHPRDAEHDSRRSQPQDDIFIRTAAPSAMVSTDQETMEGFGDRCFRSTSQPPATHILDPISRPGCSSSECVRTTMAEERIISESILEVNPQGNSQIKDRPGEFSSSCHATMANASMVADDPTSGKEELNGVIKTTTEFDVK
ncbi:hypothetical protein RMCBS344292_13047 [Rhizopus microsporus]|nr:hypothetical protein RMCBS344292_13047 [Rhizopus microsporus]